MFQVEARFLYTEREGEREREREMLRRNTEDNIKEENTLNIHTQSLMNI